MWNVNFSVIFFFGLGTGFLGYFQPKLVFFYYVRSQDNRKCDVLSSHDTAVQGTAKAGLAKQDPCHRLLVTINHHLWKTY